MSRIEGTHTWLTAEEVAQQLGVSVEAVHQYIADGKLTARKEGLETHVLWQHGELHEPAETSTVSDEPRWMVPTVVAAIIGLFLVATLMLLYTINNGSVGR